MRNKLLVIVMLLLTLSGCGGGGGGAKTDNTPNFSADTLAPVTTASPVGGTYNAPQTVTLTASETATIYYTVNGTQPTTASAVYTTPLTVSANQTVKYFAKDAAGNVEAVKTQTYTIDTSTNPDFMAPVTTATPAGGTYVDIQTVTLTASKANSEIYYTLDGTTPTVASTRYTGPITIDATTTVKYFAKDTLGNTEDVKTADYAIHYNFYPLTPGSLWTYQDNQGRTLSREVTNDGRVAMASAANPTVYSTYTITSGTGIALTSLTSSTSTSSVVSVYDPGSIIIPSSLAFGFTEDSTFNLTVGAGTPSLKTNRLKVIGRQVVTVPAGTFNALRIDLEVLTNGVVTATSSSYYVSGIGLVKDSSMALTSYHVQ